jgi:hypothetical protein
MIALDHGIDLIDIWSLWVLGELLGSCVFTVIRSSSRSRALWGFLFGTPESKTLLNGERILDIEVSGTRSWFTKENHQVIECDRVLSEMNTGLFKKIYPICARRHQGPLPWNVG